MVRPEWSSIFRWRRSPDARERIEFCYCDMAGNVRTDLSRETDCREPGSAYEFFHSQNMPEYMLSGYTEAAMNNRDRDDEGGEGFEGDLDVLRAYSLISISAILGFCDMHSLVQFCTQKWLSIFDNFSRWKSLFLRLRLKHCLTS